MFFGEENSMETIVSSTMEKAELASTEAGDEKVEAVELTPEAKIKKISEALRSVNQEVRKVQSVSADTTEQMDRLKSDLGLDTISPPG